VSVDKDKSNPAPGKSNITVLAGKGGVGKTTCAAATALHHAGLGEPTLAISTDATPSLSHIFEVTDREKPAEVKQALYISELGVEEVREMWNAKFGREVYEVFSSFVSIDYEDFTEFMTSLLPGLGDEFMVDYIRELSQKDTYEAIIWDTAPLGQTLALIQTPPMLARHLKLAPRIYSKLKLGKRSREPILDIISRWEKLSLENIRFLQDRVEFIMVTIPEALAVAQLEHVFRELDKYGLKVKQLVINNVIRARDSEFLVLKARQQERYLEAIYGRYSGLPIVEIPMFPYEVKGLSRLEEVSGILFEDGRG
jgi:arsenite-transporting ATPase